VGSVARLCANFGIEGLRLVAPRCDHLGDEARRMAVHGGELLSQASLFPSLEAALADCERVVATTGRIEGEPLPLQAPVTALSWLLEGGPRSRAALVFGREDRGLANGELLQAGRLLQIGTGPSYPSLNLSHAVAVVLHELHGLRHGSSPPLQAMPSAAPAGEAAGSAWPDPCRRDALEAALADAEALLLEVGFLLPHTSRARMAKLRALLQRAQVSGGEVALLRGMVCQLRWASRRRAPSESDT
jgi:tRNA/rRNA methyltransferase